MKNYPRFLKYLALSVSALSSLAFCDSAHAAEAGKWTEVFSDIPVNMEKWQSPEMYEVDPSGSGFAFKGGDMKKNVLLTTPQIFPAGHSYILRAEGISYATKFNSSSAYFIFGFAKDKLDMPLCLKLTRFGDGSKLVYNNVDYPLSNKPYLDTGNVELQLEYNDTDHHVVVTQMRGQYKVESGGKMKTVGVTPVIIFDKTFPEPATFGVPLMIRGSAQHNGGYVGKGLTISHIVVQASP